MDEHDRLDATLYDSYATGVPGDVEFYVEEAKRAGSPVLEIGCGTGRITFPVARGGVDVTGLDISPAMLAVARKKLEALEPEIRRRVSLVSGDMRYFSLPDRFNLIMVPFRAFLVLLTVEDQMEALDNFRDHLEGQGRLILNVFDPRHDLLTSRLAGAPPAAPEKVREFPHPETGNRVVFSVAPRYDLERQIVDVDFIFEEFDRAGGIVSRKVMALELRYIFRFEMQHLLERRGFEIEALYGDFGRGPFRAGGEQIWVARKRA